MILAVLAERTLMIRFSLAYPRHVSEVDSSVLQCVAVWCSVLQCYCSVLQCVAVSCSVIIRFWLAYPRHVSEVDSGVLQCVAVR